MDLKTLEVKLNMLKHELAKKVGERKGREKE
jgi:hypothetical protein